MHVHLKTTCILVAAERVCWNRKCAFRKCR